MKRANVSVSLLVLATLALPAGVAFGGPGPDVLSPPAAPVALAWDPSPDTAVAGYLVHYGPLGQPQTNTLDVGQALSTQVSNLVAGVAYVFFATAYGPDQVEGEASNLLTNTPSAPVTAPVILFQPASVAITIGGNAEFRVAATQESPLTYQWYKDAALLPGATQATLTLTNVQPQFMGTYTVQVANTAGTVVSSGAQLVVTTTTNPSGARPALSILTDGAGHVTLTWASVPGASYQVLGKTTLGEPEWQYVAPPLLATNALTSCCLVTTAPTGFYTVIAQP